MGAVIDLAAWKRIRLDGGDSEPGGRRAAVGRLDRAVIRLEPIVARLTGSGVRIDRRIETELLAITGSVAIGLIEEAAGRAEELLGRLEGRAVKGG